jgi:hypothetical protein
MKRGRKQAIAILVAAVIAAGGAGGALAHGGPGKRDAGVKRALNHRGGVRLFRAAADYLGLSPQALRDELRAGKSLAQVATAQGKSVDGLEQTILSAVKARLDQAVAAGRLSATREQAFLDRLSSRLDTLVNRTLPVK